MHKSIFSLTQALKFVSKKTIKYNFSEIKKKKTTHSEEKKHQQGSSQSENSNEKPLVK